MPAVFDHEAAISARFLRHRILELATTMGEADPPLMSAARWEIHNAVFAERLDLSDGRLPGGASLPALEFHKCEFQDGLCADGAHLERLLVNDCKFTAPEPKRNSISLRNCHIESEVRLEKLRPTDPVGPHQQTPGSELQPEAQSKPLLEAPPEVGPAERTLPRTSPNALPNSLLEICYAGTALGRCFRRDSWYKLRNDGLAPEGAEGRVRCHAPATAVRS